MNSLLARVQSAGNLPFLWLLLWLNLNSGPWHFAERSGPWGAGNALRAALGFVIAVAVLLLPGQRTGPSFRGSVGSLFLLKLYSFSALFGTCFSTNKPIALYFGLAHLLTIAVWEKLLDQNPQSSQPQNFWIAGNLAIAGLYAALVMYFGRAVIFGSAETAYHIIGEIEEVAGMPMSRSSGV